MQTGSVTYSSREEEYVRSLSFRSGYCAVNAYCHEDYSIRYSVFFILSDSNSVNGSSARTAQKRGISVLLRCCKQKKGER